MPFNPETAGAFILGMLVMFIIMMMLGASA